MKKLLSLFALLILPVIGGLLILGVATPAQAQGGDAHCTTSPGCTVSYDKTAAPTEVDAGGVVTVTLSLQAIGDCSSTSSPVDVMLVIDRSGSMSGQKIADAKLAAITFVNRMDLTVDQVGVASFSSSATLNHQLGQSAVTVIQAISGLNAEGGTDIASGLEVAEDEILKSGHHLAANAPVIVLLSDGQSYGDVIAVANRVKGEGIRIISVGLGSSAQESLLRAIASSESDYYYAPDSADLADIYQGIVSTVRVAARDMIITDTLSSYVSLFSAASFQGPISPTVSDDQIIWHVAAVYTSPLTLTYQISMTNTPNTDLGWPISESAVATYVDADGNPASLTFPVPYVKVRDQDVYNYHLYLPLLKPLSITPALTPGSGWIQPWPLPATDHANGVFAILGGDVG
jgi:uncharacterized protein YegL